MDMDDRQAERGHGVTALELFFDLFVVFAITQVTTFLSQSPTWAVSYGPAAARRALVGLGGVRLAD